MYSPDPCTCSPWTLGCEWVMIMILGKNTPRFLNNSVKRFYDRMLEPQLGIEHQELLFTQFLDKEIKAAERGDTRVATKTEEKSEHFRMSRNKYLKEADDNSQGSVIQMDLKGVGLTLLSTNFSCRDYAGLYKSIQKIKPDLVIAQIRPDFMLNNFESIPKKDDVFSNSLYFKQISRSPFEAMPSALLREEVTRRLKGKVTLKEIPLEHREVYNKSLAESQSYNNFISTQGINNIVLGSAAYYCERNNMNMVLGGLPEISERQILTNSHTLMELQTILKKSCEQLALYPKVVPRRIANFLYPEVFLNAQDLYLSTLLQYIIALKKHKNVLVLTGVMHNQGVKQYLLNRKVDNLLKCILPPKPEGSVLRDIENFEVVEKHCILDVMEFGDDVLKTKVQKLMTTNKMSKFYADPHHIDQRQLQTMLRFRIDTYKKYLGVLASKREEGEHLKTKEFIRRALQF